MCVTDPISPRAGETGGFVDVAMQGDARLALLDETAHGDAADVHVEGDVVDHLAVQCGAIEGGLIWRGMKKEDGVGHVLLRGELSKVFLDRPITYFVGWYVNGADAGLGRDAARIDVTGDVVALEVLELERRWRDTGVAVDVPIVACDALVVDVLPDAAGAVADACLGTAGVVVAEDEQDARVVGAQVRAQARQVMTQEVVDEVVGEVVVAVETGAGGQQVAAEENRGGLLVGDPVEEFAVAVAAVVQVGDEEPGCHACILSSVGWCETASFVGGRLVRRTGRWSSGVVCGPDMSPAWLMDDKMIARHGWTCWFWPRGPIAQLVRAADS